MNEAVDEPQPDVQPKPEDNQSGTWFVAKAIAASA